MGGSSSKSPFERRNSVERRTQRRALANVRVRLQKIEKELKAFKGTTEDEQYDEIKGKLTSLKKEVAKRTAQSQPKLKESYTEMGKHIAEALRYLEHKATSNRDKDNAVSTTDAVMQRQSSNTSEISGANSEIRQTVELKLLQVTPQMDRQSVLSSTSTSNRNSEFRSPEEKRKSILKMGVPVMPLAVMERQAVRISTPPQVNKNTVNEEQSTIERIKKEVEHLELEISTFIGRKNGTHYNRLKEKLFGYLDKLAEISVKDDELVEQKDLCVNYVKSCLNFLDEKAVDGDATTSDEDVFVPANNSNNGSMMHALSKKFAITQI